MESSTCHHALCPVWERMIVQLTSFLIVSYYSHLHAVQVRSGWGMTLARALAREATRSFLADLHGVQ